MDKIFGIIKKIPLTAMLILILVITFITMVGVIIPAYSNISLIGESHGTAAGKAIGSYDGVTKGYAEGYKEGKERALSPDDASVEIFNSMPSLGSGKLQVLTLSARMKDFHMIGDDYASLSINKCKVTYTVDLNETQILQNGNSITIIFPEPVAETSNESDPIKIFEAQKFSFSGTSEDGAKALVNSYKAVRDESEEKFANAEELKKQAIESAKKQIKDIAEASTIGSPSITVKCITE